MNEENRKTSSTATQLKRSAPTQGKNLVGHQFGRLTVLAFHEHRRFPSGKCYRTWRCQCECGNKELIVIPQVNLEHGRTVSCGCRAKECLEMRTTHGMASKKSQHRLYSTHEGMMARCYSPTYVAFKDYGARGIKVCERWHNFANFVADVFPTFREGLTLDRKNVNGDYTPENCTWSTPREQANNRRCNRFIEINGVTKTFSEWCRFGGVPPRRARGRLDLGWPPERAFFETKQISRRGKARPKLLG